MQTTLRKDVKNGVVRVKIDKICEHLGDVCWLVDEELKKYTTMQIGGRCELMVVPNSVYQYIKVLNVCHKEKISWRILGRGSNLLVDSKGINRVVINTSKLDKVRVVQNGIRAECGVMLSKLGEVALEHEWSGMEFCAGIPGSVGGAVVGNAGAFGSEMAKIVQNVRVWQNGRIEILENEKILFNFRKSVFKNDISCAIIDVHISGHRDNKKNIQARMMANKEYRTRTQSVGYPNAGCVFNNTNISPAVMIEGSGLKGCRVGDAMVSTKHSNFVVNVGNASSEDVLKLIEYVKGKIYKDWGQMLDMEIIYWGNNDV